MESVKEKLHKTIDAMSEEQAKKILDYAENIKNGIKKYELDSLYDWLAKDPNIKVPAKRNRAFKKVTPIKGKGITASNLLIEDRR
jgi:hypothetical protein